MAYTRPANLAPSHRTLPRPVRVYLGDTVAATGTVTAPAAGTVIVGLTPGAGQWEIRALYGYGATPDIVNNFRLVVDGTIISTLPNGTAANVLVPASFILTLADGQAVQIQNISAGGVGTIFIASLSATPIG